MNILCVFPRYHTNQHPSMKALVDGGHSVRMVTQYQYPTEEYSVLEPDVLGYSPLTVPVSKLLSLTDTEAAPFERNYFPPPVVKLNRIIEQFNPDVMVIRQYYVYSMFSYLLAKWHGIPVVFYDQLPLYGGEKGTKLAIVETLAETVFDDQLVRYTSVLGDPDESATTPNGHYIPFAMEPSPAARDRNYCENDGVRILSIGKYATERKNHILFLKAIRRLVDEYENITVTVIGQIDDFNGENYRRIVEFVETTELSDVVTLRTNVPYKQVQQAYLDHDLYVLPSSDEPGAVSPLEAMAHGLPVICSDTCATRCYLAEGENGFVFESDDIDSLYSSINKLAGNPDRIEEMGQRSVELVRANHRLEVFREQLVSVLEDVIEDDTV